MIASTATSTGNISDELYAELWRTGQPIPEELDELCGSCGTPYMRGCREQHGHNAYCIDISDIRRLKCGCYAHKECAKSGPPCRDHD